MEAFLMLTTEVTRPDLMLFKDGEEVSRHRDPTEAAAKAVSMGPGEYMVIQPTISIKVAETSSE